MSKKKSDEKSENRRGWIEAAARILRVALQSPRILTNLRTILDNIDPDAGGELVNAALRTDPEVPLSLIGALPRGANTVVNVFHALALELGRHPPALLREVLSTTAARIRFDQIGSTMGVIMARLVELHAVEPGKDADEPGEDADEPGGDEPVEDEPGPTLAGRFVDGVTAGLNHQAAGLSPTMALARLALLLAGHLMQILDHLLASDDQFPQAVEHLAEGLKQLADEHPELIRTLAPLARVSGADDDDDVERHA